MNGWRTIRLGSACTTNSSTYSPREKWTFVNYLDTGNITKDHIDSIQYIDVEKDKLPSRARRKVKTGSIIYSTVRPNQRHFGIIKSQPDNFLVSTGFTVIDVNSDILNADFLYYVLTQDSIVEKLHAIAEQSTSAYPSIKSSDIENLEIEIPNLDTQAKIASVLSELDRKAEQNNEINKNLLEQAQAIYTKRFITDADSLWPEGKLSDLIEVCYGKDHKKLHDGDIPVYGSGGIMRHVDRALYEQESVLVPRKGTLNNVMYVDEPFWSVDTMFFTKMKQQNVAKFVFHFLKGKDLASMNAGSAVPSMTTKILNAIPLQIPDDQTLSTFEAQVSPFYQAASYNNKESENLAAIRDSLLPKLMSGEIDVSDIDI